MKFGLKLIAAAAALASVAGAHAASWGEGSNPNVALVAYNQTTRAWFIQDLGVTMNSFLPTGTTIGAGEGTIGGTVTPEAGFNLTQNFSGWSAWYGAQTPSAVKWFVAAGDAENFFDGNESRLILSSKSSTFTAGGNLSNGALDIIAAGGTSLGGLGGLYAGGTISGDDTSSTGGDAQVEWDTLFNFGNGAQALASVGDSVGLYYYTHTGGAFGDINAQVNQVRYGNSEFFATLSLDAAGNFSYDLQPAVSQVPLPASVWLMGAGLAAMGGVIRRRRAAAQA